MMEVSKALAVAKIRVRTDGRVNAENAEKTEQRACENHGEFMSSGRYLKNVDRWIWSRCPVCIEQDAMILAADEEQRKIAARAAKLASDLRVSNIPKRFHGRTFNTFVTTWPEQVAALSMCRDYAERFNEALKSGGSLVLSGPPGTGKSHLAASIMQQLMSAHSVQYVTCMDMIRMIRATWRKDSEQSEEDVLVSLGEKIDLLVIDEVGVQYGTEGEQTLIFDVLDRRYREMRPTIIISNAGKDSLKTFVGDRVFDRLREVAKWVPFKWESYRPTARSELGRSE